MTRQLIAITGGIGSGKSYVCQLLEKRGIKVYDCDAAAKRLMRTSATLRQQLRQLVGPQVYRGCILQKRVLISSSPTTSGSKAPSSSTAASIGECRSRLWCA